MMAVLHHALVFVLDVLHLVMQPIVTIPVIVAVKLLVQELVIGLVREDAAVILSTID